MAIPACKRIWKEYQQQAEQMTDQQLIRIATSSHGTMPDYSTTYPIGLHTAAREEIIARFIRDHHDGD